MRSNAAIQGSNKSSLTCLPTITLRRAVSGIVWTFLRQSDMTSGRLITREDSPNAGPIRDGCLGRISTGIRTGQPSTNSSIEHRCRLLLGISFVLHSIGRESCLIVGTCPPNFLVVVAGLVISCVGFVYCPGHASFRRRKEWCNVGMHNAWGITIVMTCAELRFVHG